MSSSINSSQSTPIHEVFEYEENGEKFEYDSFFEGPIESSAAFREIVAAIPEKELARLLNLEAHEEEYQTKLPFINALRQFKESGDKKSGKSDQKTNDLATKTLDSNKKS